MESPLDRWFENRASGIRLSTHDINLFSGETREEIPPYPLFVYDEFLIYPFRDDCKGIFIVGSFFLTKKVRFRFRDAMSRRLLLIVLGNLKKFHGLSPLLDVGKFDLQTIHVFFPNGDSQPGVDPKMGLGDFTLVGTALRDLPMDGLPTIDFFGSNLTTDERFIASAGSIRIIGQGGSVLADTFALGIYLLIWQKHP